jgi:hypothetical protein
VIADSLSVALPVEYVGPRTRPRIDTGSWWTRAKGGFNTGGGGGGGGWGCSGWKKRRGGRGWVGGEYRGERESDGGVCGVRGWSGARGRLGGVSMATGITGRGGLARIRGGTPCLPNPLSSSSRPALLSFLP